MNGDEREKKIHVTMPLTSIDTREFFFFLYSYLCIVHNEQCDLNIMCYEICEKIIIINNYL